MKTYIKPKTIIYVANAVNTLASSYSHMEHTCNERCKIWHICRDRREWKNCYDKQN